MFVRMALRIGANTCRVATAFQDRRRKVATNHLSPMSRFALKYPEPSVMGSVDAKLRAKQIDGFPPTFAS